MIEALIELIQRDMIMIGAWIDATDWTTLWVILDIFTIVIPVMLYGFVAGWLKS